MRSELSLRRQLLLWLLIPQLVLWVVVATLTYRIALSIANMCQKHPETPCMAASVQGLIRRCCSAQRRRRFILEKHFHVRFTQSPREVTASLYRVESFDFSEDGNWELLGYLNIHLHKNDYAFYPSRRWVAERIAPPDVYALSEEEQDRRYRQELLPLGLGNGAYARKVHEFAAGCLSRQEIPDIYPEYAVTQPGLPIHR